MADTIRITPNLWFDGVAEEAAAFYCAIFPNSRITSISRFGEAGRERHRQEPGTAMVVAFELDGQPFTALNGGPKFRFNESVSFVITCETQDEIDHYWHRLTEGGDARAQACGWLKDKFGLSWQVVPSMLTSLFDGLPSARAERVMTALLQMQKCDIATLRAAYDGVPA